MFRRKHDLVQLLICHRLSSRREREDGFGVSGRRLALAVGHTWSEPRTAVAPCPNPRNQQFSQNAQCAASSNVVHKPADERESRSKGSNS